MTENVNVDGSGGTLIMESRPAGRPEI